MKSGDSMNLSSGGNRTSTLVSQLLAPVDWSSNLQGDMTKVKDLLSISQLQAPGFSRGVLDARVSVVFCLSARPLADYPNDTGASPVTAD